MNNLINNAASDMSVHWNKTNRAFTDRISECQDAHRNLKSNLILTKNVSTTFATSAIYQQTIVPIVTILLRQLLYTIILGTLVGF